TRSEGWCFACVVCENQINLGAAAKLIYLCDDPRADLNDSIINHIKQKLQVDFKSRTLSEIAAEILLFQRIPGRGLRPDLDETYGFNLWGVLWEATEKKPMEFFGRLRENELSGNPPKNGSKKNVNPRPAPETAWPQMLKSWITSDQAGLRANCGKSKS